MPSWTRRAPAPPIRETFPFRMGLRGQCPQPCETGGFMPRSLSFAIILTFFAAFSAAAQSQDSSAAPPQATSQDPASPAETKKLKKVWTNEDIPKPKNASSVL